MNKEKEILEMTKFIAENISICGIDIGCQNKSCSKCISENLQGKGYGNVKQAVKEFAEKLKSHKHLMGSIDDNSAYVWFENELDNLITELYGADE